MSEMYESSAIARLVDEQWKKWLMLTQQKAAAPLSPLFPVVTISRQRGSGGGVIGQQVADRLGFVLFDSEIVDHVARSAELDRKIVMQLDEQSQRHIKEWTERVTLRQQFSARSYMVHLTKTILTAGEKGRAVIVGRGAHLLLPVNRCFRVRVIAPWETRVDRLAAWTHVSRAEAEKIVAETDKQRTRFIRENFNQSDEDPMLYDLVVNTGELPLEAASDLIVRATRARFPQAQVAETPP